jgi:peroxiredoxin Q/BCP
MAQAAASLTSPALQVGDVAPGFALPADGGASVSLDALRGQTVVLYFYPKDDTPGCTIEANDFNRLKGEFETLHAVVLGVSKDSVASHNTFRDKYCLTFPLLSDGEGTLCAAYGTWVEKSMMGKKYMGIDRATFVIDGKGVIRAIWRKVSAKGHAEEVLEAVRGL